MRKPDGRITPMAEFVCDVESAIMQCVPNHYRMITPGLIILKRFQTLNPVVLDLRFFGHCCGNKPRERTGFGRPTLFSYLLKGHHIEPSV